MSIIVYSIYLLYLSHLFSYSSAVIFCCLFLRRRVTAGDARPCGQTHSTTDSSSSSSLRWPSWGVSFFAFSLSFLFFSFLFLFFAFSPSSPLTDRSPCASVDMSSTRRWRADKYAGCCCSTRLCLLSWALSAES